MQKLRPKRLCENLIARKLGFLRIFVHEKFNQTGDFTNQNVYKNYT